jgi:bifunctional non-homologous end joining protein LigD
MRQTDRSRHHRPALSSRDGRWCSYRPLHPHTGGQAAGGQRLGARDGYRLIARREGKAVQLFTHRGYDWTERYPAIAAAAKLRARSFTLDGEAVVSGADGIAVFDALHRRRRGTDVMLYAFDLLELNGKDLRPLPLGDRKAELGRLLAGSAAGLVFNEHTDEDGATVFEHACRFGFEGIVSKRLTAPYRSGPSRDWIKVKNPDSPAMTRAREAEW